MLNKILIANRGEIACRVIDTARRLGVRSVAVYSDFDAGARHVELADEAVHIGAAPAASSYLDIAAVIKAAQTSGAAGIHPGYGFLSENAEFAKACLDQGLVFIGPPAPAIDTMGSKQASKQLMETAAVPLIPGYHGSDESDDVLTKAAQDIGFPLMIKASAGGGGKGMRRVDRADDFESALAAARREAKAAFGDDRILLEKMLVNARHVEIQVFADNHGNVVHLFERDCSLQRRHQKVIEEAPAPGLSADTRAAMGRAAVAAARAVDYRGAGTVEFIMDDAENFYFMEMNTRLQVEHPVTEMITGVDLVEWQLRVASGEPLPLDQETLSASGWSVEARLYAENPAKRFLPATGTLHHLRFPPADQDLRIETGVREGDTIGIHYDPMIAKIVAAGQNREAAIARLDRALGETHISGLVTNLSFLQLLLRDPEFVAGRAHTQYLDGSLGELLPRLPAADEQIVALAALAEYQHQAQRQAEDVSPWYSELLAAPAGTLHWRAAGIEHRGAYHRASMSANAAKGAALELFVGGATYNLRIEPDYTAPGGAGAAGQGMTAPMPGNIVAVLVEVGARVQAGDPLVVMEAMKMEHRILASRAGVVSAIACAVGDSVDENLQLVKLDD